MLDALDLYSCKLFKAEEVSVHLKKTELKALFVCHECQGEVKFIKESLNVKRRAYFAHRTEAKISDPCSLRVIDDNHGSKIFNKFDKSFNSDDLNGLIRAIDKSALHYLFQFRNFFGAERNLYLKAKQQSESIIRGKEDLWIQYLNTMFSTHRTSFYQSKRNINEYFFKFLIHKSKVLPRPEQYITTEFHQVFHLAVSAAYKLVETAVKNWPSNQELKRLKNTIKRFDFFYDGHHNLSSSVDIFKQNLGDLQPINFSDLANMLIAERFVKIVLDMDIRGFLIDPSEFIDDKSQSTDIHGFVYVLIGPKYAITRNLLNDGNRKIIKIGETRRIPEKRAEELSAGILWEEYKVYGAVYTSARLTLEKIVKDELHSHLVAKKEYFDCSPSRAMNLIRQRRKKAEDIGDNPKDKRNNFK